MSLGPTEATYLAWLNVAELGLENPPKFFEQQIGVGLSAGDEFGDADFLRLNFACPRATVERAVERIRRKLSG